MPHVPKRYVPKSLNKSDKVKASKELNLSRKMYKKGNTIQERELSRLNQKHLTILLMHVRYMVYII